MTDIQKIQFTNDYIIGKVAQGYIVGDLNRLLDIKVIPNHDGNANFPIALYTLTSMSFLGGLVSEIESRKDYKRINAYIEIMFSPEDKLLIEPHKENFADKYRNGLAHEFFPKMAGISRINDTLMSLSPEGYWVLDSDILARMFIRSINRFSDVTDEIRLRMFDRYMAVQADNTPYKLTPTVITTTSPMSSAATTTTLPYAHIGPTGPAAYPPYSKGDTGVSAI